VGGFSMLYLVYKTTNKVNGKYYIGAHKTKNRDDGYYGSGTILKRAIKKHGIENFGTEILFEASSSEEMFTKEKELVEIGAHTYNLKLGGVGGFDFINTSVDRYDSIIKWRSLGGKAFHEKLKDTVWYKQEMKRRSSNRGKKTGKYSFKGKKHTEETKNKMRAAALNRVPWNKGKPHSPETKEKIRQTILAKRVQYGPLAQ
jgi:group I intron endonuclease